MLAAKSSKIPKGMEETHAVLTGLTDRFCAEHLTHEYAELANLAIAALCRKRPSPLTSGKPETWACAVLYALGQINFLTDKVSKPSMPMADLCGGFGVASSTAGNKAKLVRSMLGMGMFDHRWILPSRLRESSAPWLIAVNGILVDARHLPPDIQAVAVQKGLIAYVTPEPGE